MSRVTEFLQSIRADVMIGQDQTIGRYKGSAAATAHSDAALLKMLQPSGCRGEVILVLKLLSRRIVEEPKAFIGEGATLQKERDQTEEKPRISVELAHKSRPAG
jgi:hypothetical protein